MRLIAVIVLLLTLAEQAEAGILCFGGPCANGGGGGGGGTPCTNAQFDHTVACNALMVFTFEGM